MEEQFGHLFHRNYLDALSEGIERIRPGLASSVRKRVAGLHPSIVEEHGAWVEDLQSEYHLFLAALALAAYRVLSGEIEERDTVCRILGHAYVEGSRRMQPFEPFFEEMLRNSPDPFKTVVQFDKELEEKKYGKTFLFEHARDDDQCLHTHVKRCFYFDFFSYHGVPELTTAFCDADEIWMDVLKDGRFGVRCTRPTTIAYDGDRCRFHFDRIREQTMGPL